MDGQWIIVLSEHIWPFVHGFCFRSRSDKWCAIEPRGEGLGGGVRSQVGKKRSEDCLERSGRRTPPPYNRPRSHRACTATVEAVWAGQLWAMSSTKWSILVFFSSRRRHTRCSRDWSSDVCSSD